MTEEAQNTESTVEEVIVLRKGQSRYLVNGSDVDIRRLQYSTAAFGENYISSVPTYEIESIPAHSGVKIEDVDRYEDGVLIWQLNEVVWEDGGEYRGSKKLFEKKGTPFDWAKVDREKTEIGEPTPPQKLDEEDEQ